MSVTLDSQKIARQLNKAQQNRSDSLEKLSSGQIFTRNDSRPAERAIAEGLEFRLRSLAAAKRNVNDAISLVQTADSAMSEINNMIVRMKEVNETATNTTITDRERRFLFVEYQALHDEITRVAVNTTFNNIPLLNGDSRDAPDELIFRLDSPSSVDAGSSRGNDDINIIRFDGLRDVVATAEGLGLRSARRLLTRSSSAGVTLAQAEDLMRSRSRNFATSYEEALTQLSTQRSVYGAMQSRMNQAIDYIDVYQENIAAAKSRVADVDYARESARLITSNIMMQATTGLLAQGQLSSQLSINLLNAVG